MVNENGVLDSTNLAKGNSTITDISGKKNGRGVLQKRKAVTITGHGRRQFLMEFVQKAPI